ncbi:MAG: adenylate/guanylate cyclase domain-containing protein [Gemmatimonadales bacterium]|nr:adenylate/guanylate cyclase domain-containing protein [Gemmatimonadales bacterium]
MTDFELVAVVGGLRLALPRGTMKVIGRSEASDLVVSDSTISRRHAELLADEQGIAVKDLGSANGTAINGSRVSGGRVGANDTVAFGNVAFRVVKAGAPPKSVEPPTAAQVPGGTIVRQVAVSGMMPSALAPVEAVPGGGGPSKDEIDRAARKLQLLLDISQRLSGELDLDKLLGRIADVVLETMKVDRMAILLKAPGEEELVAAVARSRFDKQWKSKVPSSIIGPVMENRLAVLSDNTMQDERFKGASIVLQSVRSAMASPLLAGTDELLGLIYVDNLTATNSFSDEDLQFLIAFAGIAAIGIKNSRYAEQVKREAMVRSNFERYFAPDVAASIAGRQEAVKLGGEKRPIVILFSDIRGFTSMSETMTPDAIAELLSGYFSEMVDIIFEHDGTLDKFIGDAIMALWGAPIAMADAPDRALAAAMQMQRTLRDLNAKWAEQGRRQVSVGIGLNFGEVFAGNIGSQKRLEYTVIGDAVNVASRLCGKAAGGEILISERLYEALREKPPIEHLPPMELKGKSQAMPVLKVGW